MRWPLLFALVPLALPGCYVGPVFKLKGENKRTCDSAFLSWTGGLTYHVSQGPGDGTFDYDPLGDLVDRIEGDYDLKTGDFGWTATYSDDSFRVAEVASGVGTLWTDGDMEVAYDLDVTYADESDRTFSVHTQRYGCKEVTRIEDEDGAVRILDGTYGDASYDYVHEWIWGPLAVSAEGARAKDGSWEESGEVADGDATYAYTESSDGNGTIEHEFDGHDGVHKLVGSYTVAPSGEITMDYTSKLAGVKKETWTYTIDGSGNGEGSWWQESVSCNLKFEDYACKRRGCSDDSNGKCTPPVAFPTL